MPEFKNNGDDKTPEKKEMNLSDLEKSAVEIIKAAQDISRLTNSEVVQQIEVKARNGAEYSFKAQGTNIINVYKKDSEGKYSISNYLSIETGSQEKSHLFIQVSLVENGEKKPAGSITCDKLDCKSDNGQLVQTKIKDLVKLLLIPEIRKRDESARTAEVARLVKEAALQAAQDALDAELAKKTEVSKKVSDF